MKKLHSIFVLLVALLVSACRGEVRTSSDLPEGASRLLYHGEEMYVISAENGDATHWQPRASNELDVWALSTDDYEHFVWNNTLIFVGTSGETTTIDLGETRPNTLSPDGRYTTQVTAGQLSLRRVDQAEAQTIAHNVRGLGYWSPDGQRYVFTVEQDGTTQHILYDVASGEQTPLLETTGRWHFPLWSADSTTYSFISVDGDVRTLHRIAAETQHSVTLDLPNARYNTLFYAGNTTRLIASTRADNVGKLLLIDPATESISTLIETPCFIENPVTSPDGTSLVAVIDNWNTHDILEMVHIPLDRSPPVTRPFDVTSTLVQQIAFSPTSDKVAFIIGPHDASGGVRDLFVWDLEGEPTLVLPTQADRGGAGASSFIWSMDGQSIYAMAALAGDCEVKKRFTIRLVPTFADFHECRFGLYRVQADGSGYEQIGNFKSPASTSVHSQLLWLP